MPVEEKPLILTDFQPFRDNRGSFQKVFRADILERLGFSRMFRESFISFSKPGVIRGMHFQTPPHDHWKLVHCLKGEILDVCVDLRVGKNYGAFSSFQLSESNGNSLLIPPGFAHGFLAVGSEEAGVLYLASTEHHPEADSGIRWDSFGFPWPVPFTPLIVSERDRKFPKLTNYLSPFGESRDP